MYHAGIGVPALVPSFAAFPGCQKGPGSELNKLGLELALIWDAGMAGNGLTHYTTVPATE